MTSRLHHSAFLIARPLLLPFILLHFSFILSPAAPPPELNVLSQQYEKAIATTVTGPFQQSVSALNAKYSGGLDRAISDAKAAGKLQDILAIEAEKKRIADSAPIPAEDDESTPAALKKLRGIYREQMAKIEETRATGQLPLVTALVERLKALETTLTKGDRVDEAKDVLAYREALAAGQPPANETPKPAPTAASKLSPPAQPMDNGPALSAEEASRQIVEWAVQNGHVATVKTAKGNLEIRVAADIPKEGFELLSFSSANDSAFKSPPPWRLFQFTPNVTSFWIGYAGKGDLQPQDVSYLRYLKKLKYLELSNFGPQELGAVIDAMPPMPQLLRMIFSSRFSLSSADFIKLTSSNPQLVSFTFKAKEEITDEAFASLSQMKQLGVLRFDQMMWTLNPAKTAVLAKMPALNTLILFTPISIPLDPAAAKQLAKIETVEVHYDVPQGLMQNLAALPSMESLTVRNTRALTDAELAGLEPAPKVKFLFLENTPEVTDQGLSFIAKQFPNLEKLRLAKCSGITPQGLAVLGGLKKLTALNLSGTAAATDAILPVIADFKKLTDLNLKEVKLSEDALKSFKRKRPDIKIAK